MARPRAGDWLEDEVKNWAREGVRHVVSLLEADEVSDLELQSEPLICEQAGITFSSYPIVDRSLPRDRADALRFASGLAQSTDPIAIHCRAGIGRSSLMAAAVLKVRGISPNVALELLSKARGMAVPDTDAQRQWILSL